MVDDYSREEKYNSGEVWRGVADMQGTLVYSVHSCLGA